MQSLQGARQSVHAEFSDYKGIWRLSQRRHVLQLLDQQAVLLTKVRLSEHEYIFSDALKVQDETLRSIVQTIDAILHVSASYLTDIVGFAAFSLLHIEHCVDRHMCTAQPAHT